MEDYSPAFCIFGYLRLVMNLYNYANYNQVLICGDIHGEFDVVYGDSRIQNTLIIVAGDCGFGFYSPEYYEQLYKNKMSRCLSKNRNTVLFVRGNHDDPTYFDGKFFNHKWAVCIPDYSVVQTADHSILCVGGATSIDRTWRIEHTECSSKVLYWENEKPILDAKKIEEISLTDIHIDTVITHTSPAFCEPQTKSGVGRWIDEDPHLNNDLTIERSTMTGLFRLLKMYNHPLKQWWYGHFHFSKWQEYDGCYFRLLDIGEKDYLREL